MIAREYWSVAGMAWPFFQFLILNRIFPDNELRIGEKFIKQTELEPLSQVLRVSCVVSLFLKSVLWCSFRLHSRCLLGMPGFS